MATIRIEKAEKLGLCFGVRRAIRMLEEAAKKYGKIETLGPLAHNRLIVETLANIGVNPIRRLDEAQGTVVAVTTHGASPELLSELKARHIHTIDTTCPIVRKAQTKARELAEAGFTVIVFGDASHSEVQGLLGWAGKKGTAALHINEIGELRGSVSRIGIISQTTQTRAAFIEFAKQFVGMAGSGIEELRIINTLCKITQAQQEAAIKLARKTELMIVIGGANSANAKHLVEICSPLVETHLVETADDVDPSWLSGRRTIGITAGASTPDDAVDRLIARLKSFDLSHA